MILGGWRIGASSCTVARLATDETSGFKIQSSILGPAATPPAITSSMVAKPAPLRLTTLLSISTPGSAKPSRLKVTNFIGEFQESGFRIVSLPVYELSRFVLHQRQSRRRPGRHERHRTGDCQGVRRSRRYHDRQQPRPGH